MSNEKKSEKAESTPSTENEVVLSPESQTLCDSLLAEIHQDGRMSARMMIRVYTLPSDERGEIMRRLGEAADKQYRENS